MYIAHRNEQGEIQPLKMHLENVAGLSAEYAEQFNASQHAYIAGLLHDLGKYSDAGQKRMRDPEHTAKVDHATAGAQIAAKSNKYPEAFAIAGHHGGLPDMGSRADTAESGTLAGRLKKKLSGDLDFSAYMNEVDAAGLCGIPPWRASVDAYSQSFYTRMIFSCLVDADFLDTEAFMLGSSPRQFDYDEISTLLSRLQTHVKPWLSSSGSSINQKRNEILKACFAASAKRPGMFTLTVPTGGGKTVSSLAFALSHAKRHNMRRVIYVVPYTSIIEQNSRVFSQILGEKNVLEHHSNVDFDEDDGIRRFAAENWDAPVIVTTAVQFFESLYAAKVSRCRKLHNIANSVIVFDEAQMIPLNYLRPCVAAIAELVKHYRVSAVLCTATQPSLDEIICEFAPQAQIGEICEDAKALMPFFRRVCFINEGRISDDALSVKLAEAAQVLCIVNTRKKAQRLFEMLPGEGRFHLSTTMTPDHRSRILQQIRNRLKDGLPCRVISTSLIEAGVDVDFPELWREEAGLDSILQAAGRCNREGRRSPEKSIVHIFQPEGQSLKTIGQNISAMRYAVESNRSIDSPEAIQCYFQQLHKFRGEAMDEKGILKLCSKMAFRQVAEAFKLIESDTLPVYIPTDDNAGDVGQLLRGCCSRSLMRRLGRSCINVYSQHCAALQRQGKLRETVGGFVLVDPNAYDPECGLLLEMEEGAALWI